MITPLPLGIHASIIPYYYLLRGTFSVISNRPLVFFFRMAIQLWCWCVPGFVMLPVHNGATRNIWTWSILRISIWHWTQ